MSTRRVPHRCGYRHPDGRRCLCRMSFKESDDPPKCPGCGSRLHWYVENHRRRKADRQLCRDSACLYSFPHTIHSALCVNNPKGPNIDAMADAMESRTVENWHWREY